MTIWGSKNTSIWLLQGKTVEEYKCMNLVAETASEIQVSDYNRNCGVEYK